MAADVRAGLSSPFKELSPRYFYDERGSELFEQITELEEYYPTRCEREILDEHSAEIVAGPPPRQPDRAGLRVGRKTRVLLDAMRDAGCLETYCPVDISEEITRETAEAIADEYTGSRSMGWSATSNSTSSGCRRGAAGDRAPRRHRRQFRAPPAAGVPAADREPARARRTASCSAPTWSRTATLEAAYNDSAG